MKPGTELKIANTEEAAFLLQAELNSIERGSKYVEDREGETRDGRHYTYRGYIDDKDEYDGPVIFIYKNGVTRFEDYSKNRTHAIAKTVDMSGVLYWGELPTEEFKNVFAFRKYADGKTFIG
jgi:hypothetical protein